MALSPTQLANLKTQLDEQKQKLEDVLRSLEAGDPSSDTTRVTNNADVGTDATESRDLVEYESLERETRVMLDRVTSALERLRLGTYGVTTEGETIPYERLLIDPTATSVVK